MSKEPWEEQVFPENNQETKRQNKTKAYVKTPILTILLSIFFIIVVGILMFVLYTSNGNTDREQSVTGFYDKTAKQKTPSDTSETTTVTSVSEATTALTTVSEATTNIVRNGGTTTVQAGEGAGQIAARSGISLDQLYALNPDKLVGPGGTWWANPGDIVYIN